jgi:GTP-binding protein
MKFVDSAEINVTAGHGGSGCVSFRREKYVPKGGPNGGDGGRGGHIIFKASSNLNTLLDFKYQRQYIAKRGQHGMGQEMHGKNAADMIMPVPIGTTIKDIETGEILDDLTKNGQEFMAAKGGRGGQGNVHYKSATRQEPRHSQPGEDGEERKLLLELKLMADIGLLGLPNAGKSTLISAISAARPKIADYPFTTLKPSLGVVPYGEYSSFVIADIPGLIEGAHEGVGLGFRFLKHVERTSMLLHLVDISVMAEGDPVENLEKINKELELYSEELMKKEQTVAATKLDIKGDGEKLDKLEQYCKDKNYNFFPICAVTGEGLNELRAYLGEKVKKHKENLK